MTQPEKKRGLKGCKRIPKLDPYEDFINEIHGQGIYNCVVLYFSINPRQIKELTTLALVV